MSLEDRFKQMINGVVDLSNLQINEIDIDSILNKVTLNSAVLLINWGTNGRSLLENKNKEMMNNIDKKLIGNLLKVNDLVMDLSEFEIENEFLKCLRKEIKYNKQIGHVIFGEKNERVSENKKYIAKINEYLIRNNKNAQVFPSDYVHCLLTSCCLNTKKSVKFC